LPHIFDAFFTTKKDIGTGLGLWVTKQIVEAHGGCIHVRSRPGRGTVMALCWPKIAPTQDVFPDIVASDLAPVTGNESD
jgi:signal transduction histidine kinase